MHQDWLSGNVHMVWGTQTLNLLKEWVRVGESTVVMVVVVEMTSLVRMTLLFKLDWWVSTEPLTDGFAKC